METIEQDPNDEVLRAPVKSHNDMIFKITTGILAVTTIVFGAIALFGGNKGADTDKKSDNKDGSSQTSSDGGSSDSKSEDSLALKNFDVNIGKLVGAAGFSYGSILSIKTNADGTYMIGEVKNGDNYGFTYRKLPDGDWKSTKLGIGPYDKDTHIAPNCETEISKTELEVFANYKSSTGKELYCLDNSVPEDLEGEENIGYDAVVITAAEALKKGLYQAAD